MASTDLRLAGYGTAGLQSGATPPALQFGMEKTWWPGEYDFSGPTVGKLYDYILAGNGVFIRALGAHLEACIPVSECEVRGLTPIEPFALLSTARVPPNYLRSMLRLSQSVCMPRDREALFHLIWLPEEDRWRLDMPDQIATATGVRPCEDGAGSSYQRALIEVHSHHSMAAFFSGQDDADEQGFRIYGVLGEIFTTPKLRVRVGCYGYFWELPAEAIFELPEEIEDAELGGSIGKTR